MKVLGISGSPRNGETTDRLVQAALEEIDGETEFISLANKHIMPCIACLACVEDNICKINDDMKYLRGKIVAADAYVFGATNYFSMVNALTHCFFERFYQFRHREGDSVTGKKAVVIGVGGGDGAPVVENIKTFLNYNQIECVGAMTAQGAACCFTCGYGETCKVGAIHMFFGPDTKITPEIIPSLEKQPQKIAEARDLGVRLNTTLK